MTIPDERPGHLPTGANAQSAAIQMLGDVDGGMPRPHLAQYLGRGRFHDLHRLTVGNAAA